MPGTTAEAAVLIEVKFYAPGWDAAETDAREAELAAVERYVRAARQVGLTDDELAEDIAAQWGQLGEIAVSTVISPGGFDSFTVWVDIGEKAVG